LGQTRIRIRKNRLQICFDLIAIRSTLKSIGKNPRGISAGLKYRRKKPASHTLRPCRDQFEAEMDQLEPGQGQREPSQTRGGRNYLR